MLTVDSNSVYCGHHIKYCLGKLKNYDNDLNIIIKFSYILRRFMI